MTTTTTATFQIPSWKLALLDEQVAKLNKKAKKLSLPPVTISCDRKNPSKVVTRKNAAGFSFEVCYHSVTVSGEMPYLKGYSIAASIEIDGAATFFYSFENGLDAAPSRYLENGSHHKACEHCSTRRNRKKLVLLRNQESNELIQVGRSCLKDFIDVTAETFLGHLERINDLLDNMEKDEDKDCFGSSSGRYEPETSLEFAFSLAAVAIRKFGFVPSGSEEGLPTKELMGMRLVGAFGGSPQLIEMISELSPEEEDEKVAKETIKWIEEKDENTSSFIYNLKQMMKNSSVTIRRFGFIAGAVVSYLKGIAKEKKEKISYAESYLDADIKKRIILKDLECISVKVIDGMYGRTDLCTFRDPAGRCIIWFSSGDTSDMFRVGSKIGMCKATIKAKKTYNGIHQTVVSRLTKI